MGSRDCLVQKGLGLCGSGSVLQKSFLFWNHPWHDQWPRKVCCAVRGPLAELWGTEKPSSLRTTECCSNDRCRLWLPCPDMVTASEKGVCSDNHIRLRGKKQGEKRQGFPDDIRGHPERKPPPMFCSLAPALVDYTASQHPL